MMKYLLVFTTIIFCSCSPKIRTSVSEKHEELSETDQVVIFNAKSELPLNFNKIGTTKIGDTGFTTNCDLTTVLEQAKNEARKSGANAMLITEHLYPSAFGSTCHRIKADLLRIENISEYVKSVIVKDSVKSVVAPIVVSNDITNSNSTAVSKSSNFILLANIAQSFRLGSSPDGLNSEQKDYFKKLKSGLSYDISAYYHKNDGAGFGLKYNVYKSSGTISNQQIISDDGTVYQGDFSDDITISFIGPSVVLSENKDGGVGEAILELALGYIAYQNKSIVLGSPLKITGGNLGMIGGMGYHFRITKHLLLGPQVNFVGGMLKKLKYEYADGSKETINLQEEEFENLWRIDLAIGAKFRF